MVVVNNTTPATTDGGSNGMGFLLGVILLIVFVVLAIYYGVPYLSHAMSGPQINVPSNMNVNVHQTK